MRGEDTGVVMLNWIWIGLMVIALVVGAVNGRLEAVTKAAFDGATTAVDIALGLVGVMALWPGLSSKACARSASALA